MSPAALSTHEKVRRAAAELFASRGYGGTSMSRIAERVGVRKASLYNYYASKLDLLLDLVGRSIARWEEACRPALQGSGTHEERLAAYLRAVVDFAGRNPQAVAILRLAATQVGGKSGRRVKAVLDRHEHQSASMLSEFFAEAVESGELRGIDPLQLTLFWGAFVDGILINQVFGTAKAERYVAHLEELWRLFWRGASGRRART